MTKPQAESGGSSVASQPQACPDGVRVSLPRGCAPEISRTGLPACPWAVLSPEGRCHREQNPAAAGVASGRLLLCHVWGTACVGVSPILSSLSVSHPLCASLPLSFGVCVCVCVCVCPCECVSLHECSLCLRRRFVACRPVFGEPLSASLPGCCGRLSIVVAALPLRVCEGLDHVRRCVCPGAMEVPSPSRAASFLGSRGPHSSPGQKPHRSTLSGRRGADPCPRRWLYLSKALLCEMKPQQDTIWKRKPGMGDGNNPCPWNAGLSGQATRFAPLPLCRWRWHGAEPCLGPGLCSVLPPALSPRPLRGLDASWSG
nr:uncharacterized protein LOC129470148 [Symphalangus syndactylus]